MLLDLILAKQIAQDSLLSNILINVGATGKISTYKNNENWISRTNAFGNVPINAICKVDDDIWLGGGSRSLFKTKDFITYTPVTLSSLAINFVYMGLFYDGDLLFALGSSGALARSADKGSTWTYPSTTFSGVDTIAGMAKLNNLFVIVTITRKVATSVDGITWTQRTLPAGNSNINKVVIINDQFVICAGSGGMYISSNGINWTYITITNAGNIQNIIKENNIYIAVTSNGQIYRNTTLTTGSWSRVGANVSGSGILAIAVFNSTIIVTSSGFYLWSDDYGLTWNSVSSSAIAYIPYNLLAVM